MRERLWGRGLTRRGILRLISLSVVMPILLLMPGPVSALAASIDFNSFYQITSPSGTYLGVPVMTSDEGGNTYIAAGLNGSATLIGPGGPRHISSPTDTEYSFVAKYDSAGNMSWTEVTAPDTDSFSYPTAITLDSDGNVIVTGSWTGNVTFDGAMGTDTIDNGQLSSSSVRDTYVTKYTNDGEYQWTTTTDTSGGDRWASSTSVVADSNGNVFVGGNFVGPVIFDGVGGTDEVDGGNNSNAFLIKLASDGSYQSVYAPDNSNPTDGEPSVSTTVSIKSVTVDSSDNVYMIGEYTDQVTFGETDTLTAQGDLPYITRIGSDGTYDWTMSFANESDEAIFVSGNDIKIGTDGSLYVLGDSQAGSFYLDTEHSVSIPIASAYLAKFGSDKTLSWVRILGTPVDDVDGFVGSTGLALDSANNAYIAGVYGGDAVHFDPLCSNEYFAQPALDSNAFLTGFSANGNYLSTKVLGLQDADTTAQAQSVHVSNDKVFLSGSFTGSIAADGPGGFFTRSSPSNGTSAFVNDYTLTTGTDVATCDYLPAPDDDPGTSGEESHHTPSTTHTSSPALVYEPPVNSTSDTSDVPVEETPTVPTTTTEQVTATKPSSPLPWSIIVGGVVIVFVLGGVGFVVMRRR